MSSNDTSIRRWFRRTTGVVVVFLVGLFFWSSRVGLSLEWLSYDLLFAFVPKTPLEKVVIIAMDSASYRELDQPYDKGWNRALHTRLLRQLTEDGCPLVVFDATLVDKGDEKLDLELANAMKAHGHVVLAAEPGEQSHPGLIGSRIVPPATAFRDPAMPWGVAGNELDEDESVRRLYFGTEFEPSLAWAAAAAMKAPVTLNPDNRLTPRWLRYYGSRGAVPTLSYYSALNKERGYFRGTIVFIGGKPSTVRLFEQSELFKTPFTRSTGQLTPGVEIQATAFLNLQRNEWWTRLPDGWEVAILLAAALIFGLGLTRVRTEIGLGLAVAGILATAAAAVYVAWHFGVWFPWVTVAAIQIPCALGWTTLAHRRAQLAATGKVPGAATPPIPAVEGLAASAPSGNLAPPRDAATAVDSQGGRHSVHVPDHELLRSVGRGAYGEVWLARNAVGLYHAAKIVHRDDFKGSRPYERELNGIQNYMPISLLHPGLVHVLHVGENQERGYFYCVMELGDDAVTGQKIVPETYSPRNLAKELQMKRRLPVVECLGLFLPLTEALVFLHEHHLIHRDIKPSNIIFVHGVPKLADIGLVTEAQDAGCESTYVGTVGYIPPEGPGTVAADIYSLGKVIYETCCGVDRREYPLSPQSLAERADHDDIEALERIIHKACAAEVTQRYGSVNELRLDLLRLHSEVPEKAKG